MSKIYRHYFSLRVINNLTGTNFSKTHLIALALAYSTLSKLNIATIPGTITNPTSTR